MSGGRYQDYVILNGNFVGDFETMYQNIEDPWEQSAREAFASEKAVCLNLIQRYQCKRVVEFGSGLGYFTNRIAKVAPSVVGIEVSPTAVAKAKQISPHLTFQNSSFPDIEFLREFRPDCIVMAEITWYVLDDLKLFLKFLADEMPEVLLIHLLMTYAPGEQKYGVDKFTNLEEIISFFDMNVEESGEIHLADGGSRTFFVARFAPSASSEGRGC